MLLNTEKLVTFFKQWTFIEEEYYDKDKHLSFSHIYV